MTGRRRALLVLAVAWMAGLFVPAYAQPADVLLVFSGDAASHAAAFRGRFAAGPPLPFELFVAQTTGHVDSQPRAAGLAATAGMPLVALLAESSGFDPPPTSCVSNFPGEESATCGGGQRLESGELTVDAGFSRTESRGDRESPEDVRSASTATAHGAGTPVVSTGSSRSTTTVEVVEGRVVATTRSVVEDVVVGGVLAIDQVEILARTVAGGSPGSAEAEARVAVAGAAVNDVPVRFTSTGIEVADNAVPLPLPVADILAPLADGGITVLPLQAPVQEASEDGTAARARAEGPIIGLSDPEGTNTITVRLGVAEARSDMSRIPRVPFVPPDPGLADPASAPSVAPSVGPRPALPPPPSVAAPPVPPAEVDTPGPPPEPVAAPVAPGLRLDERLRSAYGWAGAGLLLLGGLAASSRSPRFEGLDARPEVIGHG